MRREQEMGKEKGRKGRSEEKAGGHKKKEIKGRKGRKARNKKEGRMRWRAAIEFYLPSRYSMLTTTFKYSASAMMWTCSLSLPIGSTS